MSDKKEKAEKHLVNMSAQILNRHSINHPDYKKNTEYFKDQVKKTKSILNNINKTK